MHLGMYDDITFGGIFLYQNQAFKNSVSLMGIYYTKLYKIQCQPQAINLMTEKRDKDYVNA